MNNDSTRNGGRLSLQERAARGLLSLQENSELLSLQERVARGLLPSEPELLLSELMKLEFPSHTSYEERQQPEYKGWHKAIEAAIGFKLLKARDEELTEQLRVITGLGRHGEETRHFGTITRYWITRENYRAWRLTQNNPPAGSFIHLWLGATPATESIPPVETSLPEPARPASPARKPGPARLTEAQQDKQDCQAIALELWAEQPNANQATLLKNPRIKPYVNKWKGKKTVPRWLSEVDPREIERRRGRPKTR